MRHLPPVLLTVLNLGLASGVLFALHGWFTPGASSSSANRPALRSPPVEALRPAPASTMSYYFAGTASQAELLRKMDPHGAVFLVASPADEAYADSIISDDSRQLSAAGGPALSVFDLRLDSPPTLGSDQIIESQVPAKLPGAPFEPAYGDGVTYFIVGSSAQSALLDATLQKLGKNHASAPSPVSRSVIAVVTSPEDASRFLSALDEPPVLFPGGVAPYRVVNLRS